MSLILLTVGVFAASSQNSSGSDVAVKTTQPQRMTLKRTTEQPATVRAYFQVDIHAKVAGYLRTLHVDIGDTVVKGQPIAEIEVPEMVKTIEKQEAQIERLKREADRFQALIAVKNARLKAAKAGVMKAEAQVTADRSEYQRIEKLTQSGSVTPSLRDEALKVLRSAEAALLSQQANSLIAESEIVETQAAEQVAQAAVKVAEKELQELQELMKYATLKAPFPGVVAIRNVDPGDLVRNAQNSSPEQLPLFQIAMVDKLRVETAIPERDAVFADVGDPVEFVCPALPNQKFTGTVTRKAGVLDTKTRRMRIEVDIPNKNGRLLPGAYGQMTVLLEEKRDKLALPADCIRTNHHRSKVVVYVVKPDNTVAHVPVVTGLDDGHLIEIVDGLSGDERVVTGILGRLAPNQRVKVIQ
ncbi:MAG: efflux RND transporter periplasmic adaptor subunit [Planctomycetota bacterium]